MVGEITIKGVKAREVTASQPKGVMVNLIRADMVVSHLVFN